MIPARGKALALVSIMLSLAVLGGFFFGFNAGGALSDRNLLIGEPVPEGIVAVHDFNVPYSAAERDSMAVAVEAQVPVFLKRDPAIATEASRSIGELILAATDMVNAAAYFEDRVNGFYSRGLVDLEQLRQVYQGSRAVVTGRSEENVSELFTVSEAREAMRMDLYQRGIPEEKIPQVVEMIRADLSMDAAARDSAVAVAVENLPGIKRTFLTGDEILPPGGLYTNEISRYWDAMVVSPEGRHGLVEHKAAKTGLAAVLLLMVFMLGMRGGVVSTFSEVFMLFTTWSLSMVLTLLFFNSGVPELSSFSFTMLGAAVTAVFFDRRPGGFYLPLSWLLAGIFSSIFAIHSPHPVTTFFVSFIPSCFVARLIGDMSDRAFFNALSSGVISSVAVYWLLSQAGSAGSRSFSPVVWLVLTGLPLVITGIVRVLVHPMELLFGMPTALTYQRLQSDSHPLRVELNDKAAGTYAHSALVAEMAGRAAEALGRDVLLARLGGIYHDIGKMNNPGMFIENIKNPERNSPHLKMSPEESAAVIIAHVTDGVKLGEKNNLPRDIIDIIHQHHGDSPVRYFLEKARRELPPGAELDESLYRYPCPVPQTTEAALVMLADSISSAIVGLGANATDDRKTLTVTRILRETEESGQFDECCFSPAERRKAVSIFLDVMGAKNYERVKNFPHGK